MAAIRRNPGAIIVLFGLLTASVVGWLLWPQPRTALADPPYDPIDGVTAARFETLRRDAGFDDDVLACMNLTAGQLETLLAGVRSWYETYNEGWLAAYHTVADCRARVRLLESGIADGEDQGAALATAQQQLAQAETAYETQLANLRAAVTGDLSQDQAALLDLMRAHAERPMPFRILDLTGEQESALRQVLTDYHQRLGLARDAEARATLAAAYAQDLENAIGNDNMQLLESLRGYRGAAAQQVVAALQLVFPVEAEG